MSKKKDLGLKKRLQTANDEQRAVILDGLSYDVGFGKPPKKGQFQKGQSGNRNGRPKGAQNLADVIIEEASQLVEIQENGKTRKMSKLQVSMRQLMNQAAKGDQKATAMLVEIFRKTGQLEQEPPAPAAPIDARDLGAFARLLEMLARTEGEPPICAEAAEEVSIQAEGGDEDPVRAEDAEELPIRAEDAEAS